MRYLSIITIALVLFSCNSKVNPTGFKNTISLKGFPLQIDVVEPTSFILFDSIMVLSDLHDGFHFSLINIDRQKIIKRVIAKGKADDELINSVDLSKISDKLFQVNDIVTRKMAIYPIDSALNAAKLKPVKIFHYDQIPLQKDEMLVNLYYVNDSLLLGLGSFKQGRYLVCKVNDTLITSINYQYDYPTNKEHNDTIETNFTRFTAFQGMLGISPDRTKIVYSSPFSYNYEIFNIAASQYIKTKSECLFWPVYQVLSNKCAIFTRDVRLGVLNNCIDDNQFYLAYVGKKLSEYKNDETAGARNIHVYSNDGEPLENYILDRDILYMQADKNRKTILAISIDNKQKKRELVSFKIQ